MTDRLLMPIVISEPCIYRIFNGLAIGPKLAYVEARAFLTRAGLQAQDSNKETPVGKCCRKPYGGFRSQLGDRSRSCILAAVDLLGLFLWALVMGPFDSGGICSMGPHVVYGICNWYVLGSRLEAHGLECRDLRFVRRAQAGPQPQAVMPILS